MPGGGDVQDWFKSLPFFTRYWFGLTVAFTLLGRFGILPSHWLMLFWEPLWHNFHIWRPITATFFYPLSPQTGFHFLINLYFLYNYSLRLETGIFEGRPADYAFMLAFSWICSVIIALGMGLPYLMDPLVLSILYVWCQLNKDVIVTFWFGTQFKAMYLPWVLFGFKLVISGGGMLELVGILIGHLYFFLMFKYPQDFGGASLLSTPSIFYDWFPNRRGGVHGYGQAPASTGPAPAAAQARFRGHAWGQGNRLGD